MNGCVQRDLIFSPGYRFDGNCTLNTHASSVYNTTGYLNLSKFTFDVNSTFPGHNLVACKYTLDKKFVSSSVYTVSQLGNGEFTFDLDPNYLYRFSFPTNSFSNFKAYQCNVGIGSMANELAFGKLTFLDEIGTIIPFVISLIAFALGFLLLKKMIKRGNQGHA